MTRILVIEDDTDMAAEITDCLSASGFYPERCFDGREGLNLALREDFDAITLIGFCPAATVWRLHEPYGTQAARCPS